MKSLALYIDKWYIVGAVNTDGITRLVNLPNHEDRIWLYFYEDVENDDVSYGKGFEKKFRNNENHYYGDVFSLITSSNAFFTLFKRPQPLLEIFRSAKIFDDLRRDVDEEGEIETYLSFSKDISLAARKLFIDELKNAKFVIKESVARIGHLALEYAAKKYDLSEDGFYIVLNACNENLHYSIYQKGGELFGKKSEEELPGMGTDVRSRALIEHVVDSINKTERILKTTTERENEYLRMGQFVEDWLIKLGNARSRIPIQLTNITFAKDSFHPYSVSVQKARIDQRTEKIVQDIVNVIVKFVKSSGVSHEQIKGIVFLGDTFTNHQFRKELSSHYNLSEQKIVAFKDADLSSLVSAYTFMDCSQFTAITQTLKTDAETELLRIKTMEEEKEAAEIASIAEEARLMRKREESDKERKFRDAMDKGYESEKDHDYDNMVDYFKIASDLRPKDEEAQQKYNEALQLKAKQAVLMNRYKEKIQEAKTAYDDGDWETAKQKAEEALGDNPNSKEAEKIKNDSKLRMKQSKELERYLDRADLFIAQKAYSEAQQELEKAKLLDVDDTEIVEREGKIKREQEATGIQVKTLTDELNNALENRLYDDAVTICNQLIEVDFINARMWTARLAEIKTSQEKAKENRKRLKKILSDIDTALFNEDWSLLVSLCNDALDIEEDESVRNKLAKAEDKLRQINEAKEIDNSIMEIKDLILGNAFQEAKDKLNELSSRKLGGSHQIKIKELRSLIFNKEEEAEKAKINKPPFDFSDFPEAPKDEGHKVVKGFNTQKVNPDDFDFGTKPSPKEERKSKPSQKNSSSHKKTMAPSKQDSDDFFASSTNDASKTQAKTNPSESGKISNDDFNF